MPRQNRGIVDIRLSLAFHTAPDVHTLLLLTPSRNRGKLIIEALQHLIRSTGHPAGLREVQLKAVNAWLSGETFTLDSEGNPSPQPGPTRSEDYEKVSLPVVARNPGRTDHDAGANEGLESPATVSRLRSAPDADSNAALNDSQTAALGPSLSHGALLPGDGDAVDAGYPSGGALSRWLS